MPVIYAASGNCHVYVDAERRSRRRREAIVAQRQDPAAGVCNAAETLLVHADVAARVPAARAARAARGGRRAARRRRARARSRATPAASLVDATEEDWATEFLALILAVRVVDSVEEAIEHVNRYGSGHSEAIVTGDDAAARAFQLGVDAACVYVNASTRFTDGGEFGMGAEIGNSTQKLHARGPIGLRELCTFKYLVEGDGQVARASRLARRHPRRDVQPAAHRASRLRAGGARPARARPRGADAGARAAAQGARGDPGVEHRAAALPARRRRRRAPRASRARGRSARPVLHGRYPAGAA